MLIMQAWWLGEYQHTDNTITLVAADGTHSDGAFAGVLQHRTLWISAVVLSCVTFLDGWLQARHADDSDNALAARIEQRQLFLSAMVPPAANAAVSQQASRPVRSVVVAAVAGPPVPSPLVAPATNIMSPTTLYESDQCLVCLDCVPEVLAVACGHIVTCHVCFERLQLPRKCPACSVPIVQHTLLKRI
jgi:hypothetical protein